MKMAGVASCHSLVAASGTLSFSGEKRVKTGERVMEGGGERGDSSKKKYMMHYKEKKSGVPGSRVRTEVHWVRNSG